MKTTPTLGGDPEFFIFWKNLETDYKIITADKLLPGKKNPLPCCDETSICKGTAFFDGVQAEINPLFDECRERFIRNIRYCLNSIYSVSTSSEFNKGKILFAPFGSVEVTPNDIKGTDLECRRFGCSPDENIYSDDMIRYPDGNRFMTRFAGGHIHLGFSQVDYVKKFGEPNKMYNLIKMLDILAGILSVILFQNENEKVRRKYYGKAGTFRLQPHGLEYRTLSSAWLVSPPITSLMLGIARDAFTIVIYDEEQTFFDSITNKEICDIINKCDVKGALDIFNTVVKPFYQNNVIENSPLYNEHIFDYINMKSQGNGVSEDFQPFKMIHYWHLTNPSLYQWNVGNSKFTCRYGIEHFLQHYYAGGPQYIPPIDIIKILKEIKEVQY